MSEQGKQKIHSGVDFTGIIDRIQQITGWKKESKVAEYLGISPQNLANKKTKNSLPTKYQLHRLRELALNHGVYFSWLLTGEGLKHITMEPIPTPEIVPKETVDFLNERRIFNRKAGLTEREAMIIADWLDENPDIKDLAVSWARARLSGALEGVQEADLLEFDAKARASYLLANIEKKKKDKMPGG